MILNDEISLNESMFYAQQETLVTIIPNFSY